MSNLIDSVVSSSNESVYAISEFTLNTKSPDPLIGINELMYLVKALRAKIVA